MTGSIVSVNTSDIKLHQTQHTDRHNKNALQKPAGI